MASAVSPRSPRSRSRGSSHSSDQSDDASSDKQHSSIEEGEIERRSRSSSPNKKASKGRSRSPSVDRNGSSQRKQAHSKQGSSVVNGSERPIQISSNPRHSPPSRPQLDNHLSNPSLRQSSHGARNPVHNSHGESPNYHPYSRGGFSNSSASYRGARPTSTGYPSRGTQYHRGSHHPQYYPPRRALDDTRGRTDLPRTNYADLPKQNHMAYLEREKYGKKRFPGDGAFYIDAPVVDTPPQGSYCVAQSYDPDDNVTVEVYGHLGSEGKERFCKCIFQGRKPGKAFPFANKKRSRSPEAAPPKYEPKDTYFKNRTIYDARDNTTTYIYHEKPQADGNWFTYRHQVRGKPDPTHRFCTLPYEEIALGDRNEIKPAYSRSGPHSASGNASKSPRHDPESEPSLDITPKNGNNSESVERPAKRSRTGDDDLAGVRFRVQVGPEHPDSMDVEQRDEPAEVLVQLLNVLEPTEQSFTLLKQLAKNMVPKGNEKKH